MEYPRLLSATDSLSVQHPRSTNFADRHSTWSEDFPQFKTISPNQNWIIAPENEMKSTFIHTSSPLDGPFSFYFCFDFFLFNRLGKLKRKTYYDRDSVRFIVVSFSLWFQDFSYFSSFSFCHHQQQTIHIPPRDRNPFHSRNGVKQ